MGNEIGKILSLMGRMGLIVDTSPLKESKFNIDTSSSIDNILEEGVFKSYDAEDIYKILLKHYNIGYQDTFKQENKEIGISFDAYKTKDNEYGTDEVSVISLFIPQQFSDKEKIIKFIELCGWKLSFNTFDNKNDFFILKFEKNRQTNIVNVPEFLYHLTPSNKVNKILKKGLTPHAGNKKSDHMERIYFLQEKPDNIQSKIIVQSLWQADVEKNIFLKSKSYDDVENMKRNIEYVLLEIDVNKCKEDTKFYGDPNFNNAVWTFDNIPPQAIKIIKNNI